MNLGYVAGLFDGEGCIGVYASNQNGIMLRVGLANTDELVVRDLQKMFGGSVNKVTRRSNMKLDQWSWQTSGAASKLFLSEIIGLLRIKKAQAFEALKVPVHKGGERREPGEREYVQQIAARLKLMKRQPRIMSAT